MKFKALTILLLLIVFLTGCYDHREIDETAYIVALGIDNGENNNFTYTFQFSAPLSMMSGSSKESESSSSSNQSESENSSVTALTIDAPDFYIAKNLTNNFLSKNVDMSHLKFIVFSSGISANDLDTHSQLLLREREIRPHTAIAVSVGSASEYLKNVNPELESNTSKYYELMSLRSNNIYAPPKRLHDFVDEYSSKNCDTVLPVAVSGKELKDFPKDNSPYSWLCSHNSSINSDHSVLCGMAIFKNGKLTSAMSGDSALVFNLLEQNIENCTITLRDKYNTKKTISFRLTIPEKASYSINRDTREITVSQSLEMDFLGGALPKGYHSFDELFSYGKSVLSDRISSYFQDISHNRSADIMNLKDHLRKDFLTWNDWNNFDWYSFYKNSKFIVDISVS